MNCTTKTSIPRRPNTRGGKQTCEHYTQTTSVTPLKQVCYVLSTMGVTVTVSKKSISKFLIGNRFHAKLRICSSLSNRTTKNTNNGQLFLHISAAAALVNWFTLASSFCALNSPCISAKHDETPFGSASLPLCSVIRSEITFKWTFVWYTTFSLLLVSWRLFYEFRPPESLRYFYFFYVFSKGLRSSKRSAYISQRCVFSSWMMIYWPCRCSSQVGRLVR